MDNLYNHPDKKTDVYQQVLFLLGGGAVSRFHTVPTARGVTVGHHQFHVAWFCYLLWDKTVLAPPVQLIMAALSHDMAEQVWGDVPSPAKRLNGVSDTLERHEYQTLIDNNAYFPLTETEEYTLKLADLAAGMLECVVERGLGNKFVVEPFQRFAAYYRELGLGSLNISQEAQIYRAIQHLWEQANGKS